MIHMPEATAPCTVVTSVKAILFPSADQAGLKEACCPVSGRGALPE